MNNLHFYKFSKPNKSYQIIMDHSRQAPQRNQTQSQQQIFSNQNSSQPVIVSPQLNIFGNASNSNSNASYNNHSIFMNSNTNVQTNPFAGTTQPISSSSFSFPQQQQQPQQIQPQPNYAFGSSYQPQQPTIQPTSIFGQPPVQQLPVMSSFSSPQQTNTVFGYSQVPQQQTAFFNYTPPPMPINSFGYFGSSSNYKNYPSRLSSQTFNDDEPIIEQTKVKQIKSQSKIQFRLISQFNQVQLNNNITLPCLCSIKGTGGARANVDIIAVIDISGSMFGQKIALVRDTMRYVVQMLTPQDRLSIVVYNNQGFRLCPFKFVNKDNKPSIEKIIGELEANGGNIMLNGLEIAVKILRQRKTVNEVSSIFLLSDGQEPHDTDVLFKEMLNKKQNENIGSFSLHSFGFGADHDENLMTKVCSMKDGNFYFINELSSLDEAFCNALGGIITQTASNIQINVQSLPGPIQGVAIQKVYGDKWKKVNQKSYKIEINQIMAQISKDFVFELFIPKSQLELLDVTRTLQVSKASFTAFGNNGNKVSGEAILKLQILDNSAIMKRESNSEVIESYLRLKAVEIMEQSIKLAEQGKYDLAKKQIEDIIETIRYHPNIRKDKIKGLLQDLQSAKQKCNPQVFSNVGRKELVGLCYANAQQSSFQYSNNCQQQMLFSLKARKQ